MWILQLSAMVLGAGIVLGVVWRSVEAHFEKKEWAKFIKQLEEEDPATKNE